MPLTFDNIRTIVDLLGTEGAAAGIERGIAVADLKELIEKTGAKMPPRATKRELVNELIFGATKKIDKELEELLRMSSDAILSYFESVRPSRKELLLILEKLDFHPGSEAQKSLYKYAARQISETGMFQRVAKSGAPR